MDRKNNTENKEVNINLDLKDVDKAVMSDLQKEMLQDELQKLPPLKKNQVSIDGIYTYDMGDKLEVNIYVRNGFSRKVTLNKIPLVIENSEGKVLAREIFDMKDIGAIPPFGGRPYKVYFKKENVFVDRIPMDEWKIKMEKSIGADVIVKIEFEALPEELSDEAKNNLKEFLNKLPRIKAGTGDIFVYKLTKNSDSSISIMVIVRNGGKQQMKINRLPINIIDSKGKFVGGGLFDISNICVNPYKARIYNFILKPEKIVNKEAKLSKCAVVFDEIKHKK